MTVEQSGKSILQAQYMITNFQIIEDTSSETYKLENIIEKIKMIENIKNPFLFYDVTVTDPGYLKQILYYGQKFNLKITDIDLEGTDYVDENLILVRIVNPSQSEYKKENTGILLLQFVNESYYTYLQNKFFSKTYRDKTLYDILTDAFTSKNLEVNVDEALKEYKFQIHTIAGNLLEEIEKLIQSFPIYFWLGIDGTFNFKMNDSILSNEPVGYEFMSPRQEYPYTKNGELSFDFFFTLEKVNTSFYFDEIYDDVKFENITYGMGENRKTSTINDLGNVNFDMNDTQDAFYTSNPYEGINSTIYKNILNENNPDFDPLEERIKRITGVYWNNEFFITTAKLTLGISEMMELKFMSAEGMQNNIEDGAYDEFILKYKAFVSQIDHEFNKNNGQNFKYINGVNILTNNY